MACTRGVATEITASATLAPRYLSAWGRLNSFSLRTAAELSLMRARARTTLGNRARTYK